ncbi:MAG: MBL fold metallo-hydrolase [Bryobacteraceae bacterium]|nr:MBL fold metallo-hydrolase [Bryobacteraceae bacterium]
MLHEILAVGPLECNCSILGDETSREAFVVDPGDDLNSIEAIVNSHGLRVTKILITHAHIDHIGGAAEFKRHTGAPVYLHPKEQPLYDALDKQAEWLGVPTPERTAIDFPITGGMTLTLGDAAIHVLDTPGHSPASVSLYIPSEEMVIAADTLFHRSIGRTDLAGGNHAQLLKSIREKLFTLPDNTLVIPGHGRNTTIGDEKRFNPFLT